MARPPSKNVLVIEDSFEIRLAVELSLRQEGCKAITAVDGPDGVKKFLETRPDLVILDLRMPGPDGSAVCATIREHSRVPIIVFSAIDSPGEVKKAISAGASDFVLKSSGLSELMKRVHRHVSGETSPTSQQDPAFKTDIMTNRSQTKVLLLDPDPGSSESMLTHIRKLGYSVDSLSTRDRPELTPQADVVALDYAMPPRAGLELVVSMSETQRPHPLGLVIVSRSNPPHLRRQLRKCMLLDFIEKPWQSWELSLRLKTALELFERRISQAA